MKQRHNVIAVQICEARHRNRWGRRCRGRKRRILTLVVLLLVAQAGCGGTLRDFSRPGWRSSKKATKHGLATRNRCYDFLGTFIRC